MSKSFKLNYSAYAQLVHIKNYNLLTFLKVITTNKADPYNIVLSILEWNLVTGARAANNFSTCTTVMPPDNKNILIFS